MNALSLKSRDFIRQIKRSGNTTEDLKDQRLQYARLFCDLYDVIGIASDTLSELSLGKWSVCYESEDIDNLAFHFRLGLTEHKLYPHIKMVIAPFGTSSIEILSGPEGYSSDIWESPVVRDFMNSPAYKKYFQGNQEGEYDLKTVIPQRQITSRYFGDYLSHLLSLMMPFIREISQRRGILRRAA